MRELVRYPEPQLAARLGDVLLAEGIDTTINSARDGQTVVWVRDDLHLARARTVLQEFQSQPDAPRFIEASRVARERRSQQRKAEASRPPPIRGGVDECSAGRRQRQQASTVPGIGSPNVALLQATLPVAPLA